MFLRCPQVADRNRKWRAKNIFEWMLEPTTESSAHGAEGSKDGSEGSEGSDDSKDTKGGAGGAPRGGLGGLGGLGGTEGLGGRIERVGVRIRPRGSRHLCLAAVAMPLPVARGSHGMPRGT